jgi:hypothetical protein
MNRKLQVKRVTSRFSPRSTSTVQRALSLDHAARFTQCPKRMWRSMPCSRAVSFT